MSKERGVITLIVCGLAYSLIAFSYMHKTFVSKDIMDLVIDRLDRIEKKIDRLGKP